MCDLWTVVGLVILLLVPGGTSAARASPGDVHVVGADGARLRQQPDRAAPEIMGLEPGQRLLEFERRGEWVRVGVFGMVAREGWIDRARIAPSRPVSSAPQPESPPDAPARARAAQTAEAAAFLLRVSGTPAVAFRGDCRAIGPGGGVRRVALRGLVPERFRFTAVALSCRLRKEDFEGRLRARLWAAGRIVAEAETRAPLQRLTVRSAGPWGAAAGLKGGIGVPRAGIGPGSPRGPVPPRTDKKTPPLTDKKTPPLPGNEAPPITGNKTPPMSRP